MPAGKITIPHAAGVLSAGRVLACLVLGAAVLTVSGGAVPAHAIVGPQAAVNLGAGTEPRGLALDPVTHSVYVADEGTNAVSVISEANNMVSAVINLPAGSTSPEGVAWDQNSDTIWVANNSGTVSVICGAAGVCGALNAVIRTVTISYCGSGQHPSRVVVDAADHMVYVGLWFGYIVSVSDQNYATSLVYNSLSTTHIDLGSYDPHTGLLYASAWDKAAIYEISRNNTATCTAGNNVVGILNNYNGFNFPGVPTVPEVNPVTGQLFTGYPSTVNNSAALISYNGLGAPPGVFGWGWTANSVPADSAVDQANGEVYFAVGGNGAEITEVNMATGAIKAPIAGTGINPYGIIVDPADGAGGTVFVSNNGSNTVTVYAA
jgi:YVTN family beta-propeller protein